MLAGRQVTAMKGAASDKIRLDKWLWAARFFKTRGKAKAAVQTGKIYLDGVRPKPSREIHLGAQLRIRRGYQEQTVIVQHLSEHRGSAAVAETFYQETAESIEKCARERLQRQQFNAGSAPSHNGRPTKKAGRDRRRIAAKRSQQNHSDPAI